MSEQRMAQRFWAVQIKRSLLALTVAFAAGLLFDRFFYESSERSGWLAGVVAVGLYLVAGLALGLINLATGLIYNSVWRGSDMKEAVLDDLRAAKLPPPDEWHPKRIDYLDNIADDERYPCDVRIRAAAVLASYRIVSHRSGFFNGLAFTQAADDAVLRYAQEAPKYRHPQDEE
jgi:hypothetical protein